MSADRLLARSTSRDLATDRRGRHALVRARRRPAQRQDARAAHARQRPRPHPAEHARPGDAASSSPRRLDELTARAAAARSHARRRHRQAVHPRRRRRPRRRSARSPSREIARQMAQLGHQALGKLTELGVPSFVFINGLALGGGLEIALNADYRTIDCFGAGARAARGVPRPHPRLGRRVAAAEPDRHRERAQGRHREPAEEQPDAQGPAGVRLGIADAIFPPANFLEDSIRWADGVLSGAHQGQAQERAGQDRARSSSGTPRSASPARCSRAASAPCRSRPYAALELLKAAKNTDKQTGFAAEDEALADLIAGDQFTRIHLRVQSRAEARQAPGRRARQGARQEGHQGRRDRRRAHGQPVRAAVRAPAAGAGRDHRPRPGARRQGPRLHPRTRSTSCWPRAASPPTRRTG